MAADPRKSAADRVDSSGNAKTAAAPAKTRAAAAASDTGPGRTEAAAQFGSEIRAAAHKIKEQLVELRERADELVTGYEPRDDDDPYIGTGIQRLRVAADDVDRMVDGLASAAADLERVTVVNP